MLFSTLLFYIFSSLLIVSALAVVTSKNTVHSVMFLILSFVNSAALFVMLGAEFIAMLLIIVYVGAVSVLFLFVVMMLNIDETKESLTKRHFPFILTISGVLAIELYVIATISEIVSYSLPKSLFLPITSDYTNTEAIGNVLYTEFILPFQLSGAILFVAMIGAIVLTIRDNQRYIRTQNINKQVSRTKEASVKLVKVKPSQGIEI